jgi:PadR family transcriptional regulator PadR
MDVPVTAKAALLHALVEGDGYGLELIERLKQRTRGRLALGQGSIYPALRDLERDQLVSSYELAGGPERGGRPRIYYKITAQGRRALKEQRAVLQALLALAPVSS